jgi:S-adenosylmethionine:tRNA ribosyltransferase-isomerase
MRIEALENLAVPKELIAQGPVHPRSSAKLLVYNRETKSITDSTFDKLEDFLVPETTLVLNNTKVDRCRLLFGKMEIFVLEKISENETWCMVKPGKVFRLGETVTLSETRNEKMEENICCTVVDVNPEGHRRLRFNVNIDSTILEKFKHVPLPPYMEQDDNLESEYQTVFAKNGGSVAAPTAALHFDVGQLERIRSHFPVAEVTLSVGLGTFANLRDENFESQKLHSERFQISERAAVIINEAEHVTAVGTTSLRTLEGAVKIIENGETYPGVPHLKIAKDDLRDPVSQKRVGSGEASTDIFITPGYQFRIVDSLVTNFHLPGTSLLYLVSALIGDADELVRIYQHAIANGYRFFSFGDAMMVI